VKDLAGRTFLITGANTGIGRATATELARRGARVFLGCRSSADIGRAAADRIKAASGNRNVLFIPLDLSELASVRACAQGFLDLDEPLHALINNAGVPGRHGWTTTDGFELAFGVDHLGHFALTMALLDRLADCAPARVVTLASDAHYRAPGIDFSALQRGTQSVTGFPEYAVAKLCNVLFTQELARRAADRGITTYAVHPGVVASDIWRRVPWPVRPLIKLRMLTAEQGACTPVSCATDPDFAEVTGRYYENGQERVPSRVATPELAQQLWDRSETWTVG
jgi:NAD(P)-dependent dehydrogenase (short-subunit alcohol dehydrogenase family)